MPILVETQSPAVAGGRVIRLPGLPDFNAGDPAYTVTSFAGIRGRSAPDAVMVANGGGPGALAVGDWLPKERPVTISGIVRCAPESVFLMDRMLTAAFSPGVESALELLDPAGGTDVQLFVTLYDEFAPEVQGRAIRFTYPLVAPDPYKYALDPLSGTVGVFAGVDWYRQYDTTTTPPLRTYTSDGAGGWYRTYARQGDTGDFPLSWGADSPGDAVSRRLTVTVAGPQPDGWWVERQGADGVVAERLYVDQALSADQTVVFDCQPPYSVTINGSDVAYLTFGDFLTLPPGASTFRLVAPDDLGGHAAFSALPAYL